MKSREKKSDAARCDWESVNEEGGRILIKDGTRREERCNENSDIR